MSEDRGAVSRWSQRKAAARRGETPAEPGEPLAPQAMTPTDDAASAAQGDTTTDESSALPPVEELTAQSDYTAFLGEKVPEHLRRAALRKLWSSDPVFANLDGLNHYDEDYNLVDTTITAAQTAYRVGSGYIDEIEEAVDRVEDALGAPRAEKAESPHMPAAGGYGASLASASATGDKSVSAPQQAVPSSVPSDTREETDK